MHISDGLILNNTPLILVIIMWVLSIGILAWSWKKAQQTYTRSITALLAISSEFVFTAQMINFPKLFGSSPEFSRRNFSRSVTYGAQEHQNIWNGIKADYSLFSIGHQYVSILIAGIIGVVAVLVAGLVLSKVMTSNDKSAKNNVHARE